MLPPVYANCTLNLGVDKPKCESSANRKPKLLIASFDMLDIRQLNSAGRTVQQSGAKYYWFYLFFSITVRGPIIGLPLQDSFLRHRAQVKSRCKKTSKIKPSLNKILIRKAILMNGLGEETQNILFCVQALFSINE